jgi:hypothetical protein
VQPDSTVSYDTALIVSDSLVDAYVAIDEPSTEMLLTGKVARASDEKLESLRRNVVRGFLRARKWVQWNLAGLL